MHRMLLLLLGNVLLVRLKTNFMNTTYILKGTESRNNEKKKKEVIQEHCCEGSTGMAPNFCLMFHSKY